MTEAVQELDSIIELLERSLLVNPTSPQHEKEERSYAELLSAYFRALGQAFPYEALKTIYFEHIQESRIQERRIPWDDLNALIDQVLSLFRVRLTTDMIGQHTRIYLSGSAEMTSWGYTKGGRPIYFEGPPMKQAIEYATKHCARLVTRMDEESKQLIADLVSQAIDNKRGVDGLARDLRAQFNDMSRTRARMIARTETCDALEQSFIDQSKALGITGKEWVTHEPCEICAANEDAGAIGINDTFPSGHERPPAHPNCRCALVPVMLEEKEG